MIKKILLFLTILIMVGTAFAATGYSAPKTAALGSVLNYKTYNPGEFWLMPARATAGSPINWPGCSTASTIDQKLIISLSYHGDTLSYYQHSVYNEPYLGSRCNTATNKIHIFT